MLRALTSVKLIVAGVLAAKCLLRASWRMIITRTRGNPTANFPSPFRKKSMPTALIKRTFISGSYPASSPAIGACSSMPAALTGS
jgi:hypothetical protein